MANTFGSYFRITTFGESHGGAVGVVIDGCPSQMLLSAEDVQTQLNRRRPGQSALTSSRDEKDQVEFLSGVENGQTLGTPITLMVRNQDQRPADYQEHTDVPRPSHADYTYQQKYGVRATSGGGRASARETVGRVAAGAIAEKWLRDNYNIEIVAWTHSVAEIEAQVDVEKVTRQSVEASDVRCPDPDAAHKMIQTIAAAKDAQDSVGGVVSCVCRNLPSGWGEPVFDKLEALLAHGMLSIPAVKGFEIGSGFDGTRIRGSEHNDLFVSKGNSLGTKTNNSGGVQGGISNGEPVFFRVAFKPVATIGLPQELVNFDGQPVTVQEKGRHDPCVVTRAIPIIESMAALVLADLALGHKAHKAQIRD